MFIHYEIKDENERKIAIGYDWKPVIDYAEKASAQKPYRTIKVYAVHWPDIFKHERKIYLVRTFSRGEGMDYVI